MGLGGEGLVFGIFREKVKGGILFFVGYFENLFFSGSRVG